MVSLHVGVAHVKHKKIDMNLQEENGDVYRYGYRCRSEFFFKSTNRHVMPMGSSQKQMECGERER